MKSLILFLFNLAIISCSYASDLNKEELEEKKIYQITQIEVIKPNIFNDDMDYAGIIFNVFGFLNSPKDLYHASATCRKLYKIAEAGWETYLQPYEIEELPNLSCRAILQTLILIQLENQYSEDVFFAFLGNMMDLTDDIIETSISLPKGYIKNFRTNEKITLFPEYQYLLARHPIYKREESFYILENQNIKELMFPLEQEKQEFKNHPIELPGQLEAGSRLVITPDKESAIGTFFHTKNGYYMPAIKIGDARVCHQLGCD